MARSSEKARAMLNRFLSSKEAPVVKERRPFLASEVQDLPTAERWRTQVIKEIGKNVAEIQNGKERAQVIKKKKKISEMSVNTFIVYKRTFTYNHMIVFLPFWFRCVFSPSFTFQRFPG